MIWHLVLSVTDFKQSEVFYDSLIQQCWWHIRRKENHQECEIKSYGLEWYPTAVMIRKDKVHKAQSFVRYPWLDHLCLHVKSKELVDSIYNSLVEQWYETTTTPNAYSEYSEDYYAFSFKDPDGIPLEVAYY